MSNKICTPKTAARIMGPRMLGPAQIKSCFKPYWKRNKGMLAVPWTEEVLYKVSSTHLLLAGLPLNILEIGRQLSPNLWRDENDSWYTRQSFAFDRLDSRYYLIGADIIPTSNYKTYSEQLELFQAQETPANLNELFYALAAMYLSTGGMLFPKYRIRTADQDQDGCSIILSTFQGIDIGFGPPTYRIGHVGIVSSYKPMIREL